jgi:hypothetical protein
MSAQSDSTLKYAIYGLGAVALAGAVWWLTWDPPALDKGRFTKEKLEKFLAETSLEFTCIYCRNYNLMLKVDAAKKSEGKEGFSEEDMGQLKSLVDKEIRQKTEQLCEDFEFDPKPKATKV